MKGIFLIVGLTILCTPMIECSMGAFHFGKKKLNHASPKSNLKTGKLAMILFYFITKFFDSLPLSPH